MGSAFERRALDRLHGRIPVNGAPAPRSADPCSAFRRVADCRGNFTGYLWDSTLTADLDNVETCAIGKASGKRGFQGIELARGRTEPGKFRFEYLKPFADAGLERRG